MEYTQAYKLSLGAEAPPFADLPAADGQRYGLADFSDARVLVVTWWCNHCPYVRAWEERTTALARAYEDEGVRFVAINANDAENYPTDDLPHMVERAQEKAYPFPYLRDDTQKVAETYGATVTPHYQVFDADRRLVYQGRFDDSRDAPQDVQHAYLKDALDAVLAGRTPEPAETPAIGCSVKWRT